jgi:hypothetical protein
MMYSYQLETLDLSLQEFEMSLQARGIKGSLAYVVPQYAQQGKKGTPRSLCVDRS